MAATPPLHTHRSADKSESFNAPVAVNLLTRSGKPNFAPQKLLLIPGAGGAVTLVDEADTSLTFTLAANGPPVTIDRPIKTLSAAGTFVIAYWYTIAMKDDFAYAAYTVNP